MKFKKTAKLELVAIIPAQSVTLIFTYDAFPPLDEKFITGQLDWLVKLRFMSKVSSSHTDVKLLFSVFTISIINWAVSPGERGPLLRRLLFTNPRGTLTENVQFLVESPQPMFVSFAVSKHLTFH